MFNHKKRENNMPCNDNIAIFGLNQEFVFTNLPTAIEKGHHYATVVID